MKTVQIKQDEEGNAFLSFDDIADLVDVSKIEYYSLEEQEDGSLILTLFDKDEVKINVKS